MHLFESQKTEQAQQPKPTKPNWPISSAQLWIMCISSVNKNKSFSHLFCVYNWWVFLLCVCVRVRFLIFSASELASPSQNHPNAYTHPIHVYCHVSHFLFAFCVKYTSFAFWLLLLFQHKLNYALYVRSSYWHWCCAWFVFILFFLLLIFGFLRVHILFLLMYVPFSRSLSVSLVVVLFVARRKSVVVVFIAFNFIIIVSTIPQFHTYLLVQFCHRD